MLIQKKQMCFYEHSFWSSGINMYTCNVLYVHLYTLVYACIHKFALNLCVYQFWIRRLRQRCVSGGAEADEEIVS